MKTWLGAPSEPLSVKRGQRIYDLRFRILRGVTFEPNSGCWLWLGCSRGDDEKQHYGRMTVVADGKKKNVSAHRMSYEAFVGCIPDGMEVCHQCDVSLCVNPNHLFVGTRQDNIDDREKKGRNVVSRGEDHGQAKITTSDVIMVKGLLHKGLPYAEIAARAGVPRQSVKDIAIGRRWRHVDITQPPEAKR